ncbi:uncharacterized protein L969DRAFT_95775 [Mixia osmundae IAM 14324]|uniref:Large ribosomal subunit protein uL4m n=1 Tax=Mixia osmundae (strain CBS 9802 / IAM 14324 / JCM 22182 / KY 12970) TaxID=764103 RepID=G7DSL9_MIXOS|nr:uncharacterized protein L969DRAFT_95775 [Mixia osmundae IAM 14324]KEI37925.1 hypothetical protein L969DRAFT_95775 [Mixia osmundae IAM 14324]GAA93579.1 hypothetical protein E5Q_00223 [Mixia osmundae IAM 14324]
MASGNPFIGPYGFQPTGKPTRKLPAYQPPLPPGSGPVAPLPPPGVAPPGGYTASANLTWHNPAIAKAGQQTVSAPSTHQQPVASPAYAAPVQPAYNQYGHPGAYNQHMAVQQQIWAAQAAHMQQMAYSLPSQPVPPQAPAQTPPLSNARVPIAWQNPRPPQQSYVSPSYAQAQHKLPLPPHLVQSAPAAGGLASLPPKPLHLGRPDSLPAWASKPVNLPLPPSVPPFPSTTPAMTHGLPVAPHLASQAGNYSDKSSRGLPAGFVRCSQPSCFYAGPDSEVEIHEADRHLIFRPGSRWAAREQATRSRPDGPAGSRIMGINVALDTEDKISRWVEERKSRWPSQQRAAQKQAQQREAAEEAARSPLHPAFKTSHTQRGRSDRGRGRGSFRGREGAFGDRNGHLHDELDHREDGPPASKRQRLSASLEPAEPSVPTPLLHGLPAKPVAAIESASHHSAATRTPRREPLRNPAAARPLQKVSRADEAVDDQGPVAEPVSAEEVMPREPEQEAETKAQDEPVIAATEAVSETASPAKKRKKKNRRKKQANDDKAASEAPTEDGSTKLESDDAPEAEPVRRTGDQEVSKPTRVPPPNKQTKKRKAGPATALTPHNPFKQEGLLSKLLERDIEHSLSDLSQAIDFLVANEFLRDVELVPGEAEEAGKIEEVHSEKRAEIMSSKVDSVQTFGKKKTATAVALCKAGKGLIRVNGTPIHLIEPQLLRFKVYEPVLVLYNKATSSGANPFESVDIRVRVTGGGHTSQVYAVRQALAKAVVAYTAKYQDAATSLELKKTLIAYDRTLLVADPVRVEYRHGCMITDDESLSMRRDAQSQRSLVDPVLVRDTKSRTDDRLHAHLARSLLCWHACCRHCIAGEQTRKMTVASTSAARLPRCACSRVQHSLRGLATHASPALPGQSPNAPQATTPQRATKVSAKHRARPEVTLPEPVQRLEVVHLPLSYFPPLPLTAASSPPEPHLVALPAHLFNAPSRKDILHRCVVHYLASKRQGTHSQKTRSEVAYSGRKLTPQKGTGNARKGDRGAPHFRGGGAAFAVKPRDWSIGIQRKVVELGIRTALSTRWRSGELSVIESVGSGITGKTRELASMLSLGSQPATDLVTLSGNIEPTEPHTALTEMGTRPFGEDILFIFGRSFFDSDANDRLAAKFRRASENLPTVDLRGIDDLDVYALLRAGRVVLDFEAVEELADRLAPAHLSFAELAEQDNIEVLPGDAEARPA